MIRIICLNDQVLFLLPWRTDLFIFVLLFSLLRQSASLPSLPSIPELYLCCIKGARRGIGDGGREGGGEGVAGLQSVQFTLPRSSSEIFYSSLQLVAVISPSPITSPENPRGPDR